MVSKNGFSSIKSKYPSLFSPQGNVHMSFYPIDSWSALFIIDEVISNTCNSKTNNVKAKAAASATKVFIDEAQKILLKLVYVVQVIHMVKVMICIINFLVKLMIKDI